MKENIILTLATEDDVEALVESKMDTALWCYDDLIPTDKEATRKEVTERLSSDWYKQYLIRLDNPERTVIGELHLHWYVKERESWELGYCISPEHCGHGYATEAANVALTYAFEDWKAHKVVAMCNEHNIASFKVMEKLGMVREGTFREEFYWQGRWVNQLFYSLLDSEYQKMRS